MSKISKVVQGVVLSAVLLFPSLLLAAGDLYDTAGLDANRNTLSLGDFDNIDPFTGGLILNFEDMRLPGNGGLDLVVQRTFNSKNSCRHWSEITWLNETVASCKNIFEGDSWIGNGWTMHFGRLLKGGASSFIIEMPDGSLHEAFLKSGSSDRITKNYWILQWVSGNTYVLKFTDGRKITFDYYGSKTADGLYDEYYASMIEDTNGNVITIHYNDERDVFGFWKNEYKGSISYITDSVGRVTTFTLTSALIEGKYRLSEITRPDGKKITFVYAPASAFPLVNNPLLLTEVIPPEGQAWKYAYNYDDHYDSADYHLVNDLVKVTTPFGGVIDYTYGTTRTDFGYGNNYYSAYRTVNRKTATGRGILTGSWDFSYFQDTGKDYTVVTDPCGRTIKFRHYGYASGLSTGNLWKLGLPISREIVGEEIVSYEWTPSASISYDDYSLTYVGMDNEIYAPYISKKTVIRDGQTYITTYSSFDSYGNPRRIIETGNSTRNRNLTYWYNTARNLVHGKPQTETVSGVLSGLFTTAYDYEVNTGNLVKLTRYGVATNYEYYTNGNLRNSTDANSKTTTYEWQNGQISKTTNLIPYSVSRVINANGTVASETNGRGYATSYAYDGNLRLTRINPPAGNISSITYPTDNSYKQESRGGYWLKTTYDGLGRPTGTSDSKGVATSVVWKACGLKNYTTSNIGDTVYYDSFGRPIKILHKDSSQILYAYSGNTVTVTDEAGVNTMLNHTAFGSPDDRMLTSVKDAKLITSTYTRNILGSLTGITQAGISRSFTLDTRNYLTGESHPETGSVTYGRDNVGNMTSMTDASGIVNYTYDNINRLTSISFGNDTITYGYDNANNRTGMISPGATATYIYDAANRMTSQTRTISGRAFTTSYGYDNNDNLTSLTYPKGLALTYAYSTNNQLTSVTGFGGSVTGLVYNTAGLPTGFSYSNGKATSINYNNRNMTTLINAGTAYNTGFGYDSKGNTMSITDNLPATPVLTRKIDPAKGTTQTTTYGYASNRMTSLSGAETAAYGYNNRGDMTSLTENSATFTPEYDLLHNLKAYKQGSTTIAAYGYDGDGLRVTKTAGGTTTVYHHDKSGKLLSETDSSGNRIVDYVYVNGNMAAKVENTGVSYYHVDPAGTPVAITDSAGVLVWRAEYLPFGEEQLLVNTKVNDKMFVGKEKDEETGLYYFGARYMQDRNARFVSVDPVGPVDSGSGKVNEKMLMNPQRINRYAYALNNPYRYVDPDGRYERDVHYDLTYYLAMKAGFAIAQARQVSASNQDVDDNANTGAFAGKEARKNYHFATTERLSQMFKSAQTSGDLNSFGQYLHAFQDSFSHEGYGPSTGHALAGTAPDKTYNDPDKANRMAEATYKKMISFQRMRGLTISGDFNSFRSNVDQFNRAKTINDKNKVLK